MNKRKENFSISQTKKNIGQTARGRFKRAVSCFEGVHLAAIGFGNHFVLQPYVDHLIEYTSHICFWDVIKLIIKNDGLILGCVRFGAKTLRYRQRYISGNIIINKVSTGIWRDL